MGNGFERRSLGGDTRHWANSDVFTTPAAQATHNRYSPRCVILLGKVMRDEACGAKHRGE